VAGEARRLRSCGLGAAMLRPLQHLEEGFGMSMNATAESDACERGCVRRCRPDGVESKPAPLKS